MRAHLWCWAGGCPTTLTADGPADRTFWSRSTAAISPADVKNHLTLTPSKIKSAYISALATPHEGQAVEGWTAATTHRYEDGLQVAHYTRLLQSCGYHPGPGQLRGAVLGTSRVEVAPGQGAEWVFVWHNLDLPLVWTFSRSQGKKLRSLLERYDHEHSFRIKVAETARQVTGSDADPRPLVEPIGQDECRRCPYEHWCAEQMGQDDPSAALTIGRLGTREWLTLRGMGVTTTAALSAVDPDDPVFFDEYAAEVSHVTPTVARKRLVGAIERAEMICDGIDIKRTGDGPVDVPVADVEIDVDMEYDLDSKVYLWVPGASAHRRLHRFYIADFVEWEPLDAPRRARAGGTVRRLAARAARRSRRTRTDMKVFHWSHPERSKLKSIMGLAEVGDLVDPRQACSSISEGVQCQLCVAARIEHQEGCPDLRVHLAGRRSRW